MYSRHVKLGGEHGRMAHKAASAIINLTNGLPAGIATTNHGESRLRNCVKYALSDGFRLVTVQDGDSCFILHMGSHDSTDDWLKRHRGMQIVFDPKNHTVGFVALLKDAKPEDLRTGTPTGDASLFAALDDLDWEKIIPSRGLRKLFLRLKTSDSDAEVWDILSACQEEDQALGDALVTVVNHLRGGQITEAKLALSLYLGEAEAGGSTDEPIDLAETFRQPENADRFIILNDLDEAQRAVLFDPMKFQEWMVFLHPGQRRVVDEDFDKPAILTGVSGSGKTCVLVHRAKRMAEMYPDERILILTLNKSLARLIENLVAQVCPDASRQNIDVMPYHEYISDMISSLDLTKFLDTLGRCTGHDAVINEMCRRHGPRKLLALFRCREERHLFKAFKDFLYDPNMSGEGARIWAHLSTSDIDADPVHYLYEELELVRSAFPSYGQYEEYLEKYERPGRAIPLPKTRREQVLQVLHEWEHHQFSNGFLDHMGLSQAAHLVVEDLGSVPKHFSYRCVLVDEFQDFSTLDLTLLKAVPKELQNGLFLAGDMAQKLYAKELNFGKASLGTGQRVLRSIRKNYRNSKQILLAGDSLLRTFPPATDVDGDLRVLDPELADRESAKPIATKSPNPVLEAWRQAEDWLASGNPGFSICIATANPDAIPVESILSQKPPRLIAKELSGDYMLNPTEVIISDITTIKGFEFSLIIILGLEDGTFPYAKRPGAEVWRDAMRLYVAITRGRDEVRFPYSGKPSRFLEAMGEHVEFREIEDTSTPSDEPITISTETENIEIPVGNNNKTEEKTDTGDTPPVEPIEPPPPLPRNDGNGAGFSVTFLNGKPCVTLPQGIKIRELAEFLSKDEREMSARLYRDEYCVSPDTALPSHIVRKLLGGYGILVNILGEQLPANVRDEHTMDSQPDFDATTSDENTGTQGILKNDTQPAPVNPKVSKPLGSPSVFVDSLPARSSIPIRQRAPASALVVILRWELLQKGIAERVACNTASATLVRAIERLTAKLGVEILDKVAPMYLSRTPLFSKNPQIDFLNQSTGELYAHQRIGFTPYFVKTHSDTKTKIAELQHLERLLALPANFFEFK